MKYSIVIPTYNNCDKYFKYCIESIIKYTDLEDVEIAFGIREKRSTPPPIYNSSLFERMMPPSITQVRTEPKVGRNDPCPCGRDRKSTRLNSSHT